MEKGLQGNLETSVLGEIGGLRDKGAPFKEVEEQREQRLRGRNRRECGKRGGGLQPRWRKKEGEEVEPG